MDMVPKYKSTEDWELEVGAQIKQRRLVLNISVAELAMSVNISEKSVQNLEGGKGSSLATLIKVVRGLGNEEWLQQLSHESTINPVDMLRRKYADKPRERASKKCKATPNKKP